MRLAGWMTTNDSPRSPQFAVQVMTDILRFWELAGARGVVIGGVASSVLGTPRFTKDIDATMLVNEENLEAIFEAASIAGFETRAENPVAFALEHRMVLLRHRQERLDVDVSLAGTQFEIDAVYNADKHDLAGVMVPLPRPADLVVMKAFAGRPQDYGDLEALLDAHPDVDFDYVHSELSKLCSLRADYSRLYRYEEYLKERAQRLLD